MNHATCILISKEAEMDEVSLTTQILSTNENELHIMYLALNKERV